LYNVGGIHLYHIQSQLSWGNGIVSNENIFRYKQKYYEDNKKYINCIDFIPKIFFTYWEGNNLTKLHYYTIKSLLKYNPEISITVYTSKVMSNKLIQWNSKEHRTDFELSNSYINLNDLIHIDNTKVKLIEIDFEKEYSIDNNISIIYKADFTRIAKLYEHGGVWFDMDILFINKIPDYIFQNNFDIYYYYYLFIIPTGLLFSTPKNKLITILYEKAYNIIKNIKNEDSNLTYQKLGPNLWLNCFHEYRYLTQNTSCIDKNTTYAYDCNNILDFFNSNKHIISDNTFCIHWYNGDPEVKKIINNFDVNSINPEKSVFERLIYNIIN
jgi:hypothetical protein